MNLEPRRVLFVLPSLEGGGAQRAVVILLRHLEHTRFEPHLALLASTGPYLKELPQDLPVHRLHVQRVRYAIPALVRLAWKLRPQVVVSSLIELNLAMVTARPFMPRGLRLLLREDTAVGAQLDQDHGRPQLKRWLYRRLYPRADRIICVADYVLNDLAVNFGIPREKMMRIYNPVEIGRVRELADASGNPYGDSSPRFITAGRLAKVKGIDLLLDAMALVGKKLPSAELMILGEGPLESALKRQTRQLGLDHAVHFPGFQPNPYGYMRHADVFVLASRYEGLPLVLLEALALGTPVVATDCPGGVREILSDCPMGRLIPALDAQALAEAMIAVYNAGWKRRLQGKSAGKTLSRFSVEQVVGEYERLISE
jgi:glycosyltransferase involved in cell wall biosynthesis